MQNIPLLSPRPCNKGNPIFSVLGRGRWGAQGGHSITGPWARRSRVTQLGMSAVSNQLSLSKNCSHFGKPRPQLCTSWGTGHPGSPRRAWGRRPAGQEQLLPVRSAPFHRSEKGRRGGQGGREGGGGFLGMGGSILHQLTQVKAATEGGLRQGGGRCCAGTPFSFTPSTSDGRAPLGATGKAASAPSRRPPATPASSRMTLFFG